MCTKRKYRIFLLYLLLVSLLGLTCLVMHYMLSRIPDQITLNEKQENVLDLNLPLTGEIETKSVSESNVSSVNFNQPVSITTGNPGEYNVELKLFGFIKYKNITLNVVENKTVFACGLPVGVYLKSDGILVVDNARFVNNEGNYVNPSDNIIKKGDYIVSINGARLNNKNELIDYVMNSEGNPVILEINREGSIICVKVIPQKDSEGDYKLGLWVRDDTQGIGTLTYIDSDGNFGALGHGISDIDTGEIFEIHDGILYTANILNVVKGQSGTPGEYVGTIDYSTKNRLGTIYKNCERGVFGKIVLNGEIYNNLEKYEIGYKYDVKPGRAYILSGIDSDVKKYEIRIDAIDYSSANVNKGIEFSVVDPVLLERTNGIVQGMSGSPIIQNGRIVGAVTHVFVNNPTKGYGIFIENMLEQNVK